MSAVPEVKVWDPFVRVFHWSLVAGFTVAYLTGDEWLTPHVYAGYVVGVLVLARLVWGVIGTPHARFTSFVQRPSVVLTYLKDVALLHPRRYLGHNPAGAAMIVLMLLSLTATVVTGLMVLGGGEHAAGPLAGVLSGTSHGWAEGVEEVHEFFANFTLLLVVFHVLGVIAESLLHRENLVWPMFTGRKHG